MQRASAAWIRCPGPAPTPAAATPDRPPFPSSAKTFLVALALALAGICPGAGASRALAQEVAARAVPDTVTVGDRFVAVARIALPAGARAEMEVAVADTSAVGAAGEARLRGPDSARTEHLAAVPLVAWRTGRLPAVTAVLRVTEAGGGTRTVRVPLALPWVRSVLPADTAGVRPKGPRDVLDPPRDWRALAILAAAALLALVLLALLARALVRWWRRPRRVRPADARAEALAALERVRASGLLERGEWKEFYAGVAEALRGFAAAMAPGWGRELTTAELAARMGEDGVPAGEVEALAGVLAAADLAKFARWRFAPEEGAGDLAAAREWVRRFDPAWARPPAAAAGGDAGEAEAGADQAETVEVGR